MDKAQHIADWANHEQKVRRSIFVMFSFALLAIAVLGIPFFDITRPPDEALGVWWARAGAPMTVFAIFSQNAAVRLGEQLQFGSFGSPEMSDLRKKYLPIRTLGLRISITLIVIGTLVWGYGDLILIQLIHYVKRVDAGSIVQHQIELPDGPRQTSFVGHLWRLTEPIQSAPQNLAKFEDEIGATYGVS